MPTVLQSAISEKIEEKRRQLAQGQDAVDEWLRGKCENGWIRLQSAVSEKIEEKRQQLAQGVEAVDEWLTEHAQMVGSLLLKHKIPPCFALHKKKVSGTRCKGERRELLALLGVLAIVPLMQSRRPRDAQSHCFGGVEAKLLSATAKYDIMINSQRYRVETEVYTVQLPTVIAHSAEAHFKLKADLCDDRRPPLHFVAAHGTAGRMRTAKVTPTVSLIAA
ncbi:hypothetical protein EPH_0000230 [Eimeria praecox]|uniref:Uncharacterized protein n=1 Tax=Eimeria praecox TaxID=51316 RepID=U6H8C6_9EIME|nr:hypothetical protein EPH_0000230 [Eimeria praecox]